MSRIALLLVLSSVQATLVQSALSVCPTDKHSWVFGDNCIDINDDTMDWDDARAYCRKRGGDLVSIHTPEEQLSVEMHLKRQHHDADGYWIGATDRDHEGTWLWVYGNVKTDYVNWDSGQGPLQTGFFFSGGGLEDCAMIRPDAGYKWHDGPCAGGPAFYYGSICQYDLDRNASQNSHPSTANTMSSTALNSTTAASTSFKNTLDTLPAATTTGATATTTTATTQPSTKSPCEVTHCTCKTVNICPANPSLQPLI